MPDWNRVGKTKAITLGILFTINLVKPISPNWDNFNYFMVIAPLIIGLTVIPILMRFKKNYKVIAQSPSWNDNPFDLKRPLKALHFTGFFMLIIGLSLILGTAVKYLGITPIGLITISYGIGILAGINLTIGLSNS